MRASVVQYGDGDHRLSGGRIGLWLLLPALICGHVRGEEKPKEDAKPAISIPGVSPTKVQELAESVRQSVVIVRFAGRDGNTQGLGSGFVIGADGIIATNMHVIGEARPITVEFHDGAKHEVTAIHASDRSNDLALLRIEAKELTPLPLGDSDAVKQGQAVVAMGNPLGLTHSIVTGVVSAVRENEQPRLQLSMPIVRGISGSPLMSLDGKVLGVISQRSLQEASVGYAVAGNKLKPLLESPNPIVMKRWLTIGALDHERWKPLFGARWKQRAGRLIVSGAGNGFGGRSLCLWQPDLPKIPYEIAVTVKLDSESSAAGLVFHSDGADRHYGFYPTTGNQLRLSRFDGPDVFSWNILEQVRHPSYRPGDWNTLKVRVEKERILCYVNDNLAIESRDRGLTGGRVGLAKFRDTNAEFKRFRVGDKIQPPTLSDDRAKMVKSAAEKPLGSEPDEEFIKNVLPEADAAILELRRRSNELEQRARRLKELALAVHQRRIQGELASLFEQEDESKIDLLKAGLLLARLENEEVDVDAYIREVESHAKAAMAKMKEFTSEADKLNALVEYMFQEQGFHGGRTNYYSAANSYLNEVIDDREGLPISLSVLFMEIARRTGLNVVGIPLPGHFVVRHEPEKGDSQFIDVFDRGRLMTELEAKRIVLRAGGDAFADDVFKPASKKAVILRMINNLINVAARQSDRDGLLRNLNAYLALEPDSPRERWMRGEFSLQANRPNQAARDFDWLLERQPRGVDLARVRRMRELINQVQKTD